MKKTQKIIIKRKGGVYSIKGNGDAYLLDLATGAFKRGEMKMTFGQKLRRFLHRFRLTADHWFDEAAQIALGTDVPASEIEYIGLLEERTGL